MNGIDKLLFGVGISSEDIEFGYDLANNTHLVIGIKGSTDSITIQYYFDSISDKSYQLEAIEFANGTVWTQSDIMQRLQQPPVLTGTQAMLVCRRCCLYFICD